MRLSLYPALLLMLALLPGGARAQTLPALTIAVDNSSPPFAFENHRHQAQGIYVSILQAVAQRAGLTITVKAMPWRRAIQGLDIGQHGVAGLYKNKDRAQRYLFSDPIWQENVHVFTLPASTLQVNTTSDLAGNRLGALAGWFYSDALLQMLQRGELTLEAGESDAQNIGKLRAGRLDAILSVKDSIDYLLRHHPRQRQSLRDAGLLISNPTHIALPFTTGNVAVMDRINSALRQIDRQQLAEQARQNEGLLPQAVSGTGWQSALPP